MGGTCSKRGAMRNTCNILIGKPERKRSLWRHRRRGENNINMGLKEARLEVD
jgi:hypothetical protein